MMRYDTGAPVAKRISSLLAVGLIAAAGFWATTALGLPPERPTMNDRVVSKVISGYLAKDHISRRSLDDEISVRALKLFLESMDPAKLYFMQSDVDEFSARRSDLDDMVRSGDVSFAYAVHQRLYQRAQERLATARDLLSKPVDFSADEEIVIDRDALTYAKNEAEAVDRWRKKVKYDLLVLKAQKTEGDAAREKLSRRYQSIFRRIEQMDGDELLETFLTAITSAYDPHTSYMSPTTLENFRILMRLNLEGIGAALSQEDGNTIVSHIIPGGAADKQGKLKAKDRVVSVGEGKTGEMVDVVDMKLNDVVKKIRGRAGTIVRLGVISEGETEAKIHEITRAKIELEDSAARSVIYEDGKKANGTPYKLGVIDLPSFYMDMEAARDNANGNFRSTTRDVRRILDEFSTKGVDAVVVDLRRNGGGSLTEAISLTGLFIDEGPVVQVKDANGDVNHYDDEERGMAWNGPLVVLISKFSASASEIFAGAIQDYQRGLVIGDESTHGKGTVQSLMDLGTQYFRTPNAKNLGALKITMQQFYRPNGDSTQKRGVLADVTVPSLTNFIAESEANLDFALEFDKTPSARYSKVNLVNPDLVTKLAALSAARRRESNDFQKLEKTINQYRALKARKTMPLNEAKFFAQRAELDAESEEEKQIQDQERARDEVFKRDFYNNEVLNITLDYLQLMQQNKLAVKR